VPVIVDVWTGNGIVILGLQPILGRLEAWTSWRRGRLPALRWSHTRRGCAVANEAHSGNLRIK
jgi:hypothetical protein